MNRYRRRMRRIARRSNSQSPAKTQKRSGSASRKLRRNRNPIDELVVRVAKNEIRRDDRAASVVRKLTRRRENRPNPSRTVAASKMRDTHSQHVGATYKAISNPSDIRVPEPARCKQRPESSKPKHSKGRGTSRGFIPWCDRKVR